MRNSTKFLFLLLFSPFLSVGQFNFEYDDSIGVRIGTDTLAHAWVGGLNYAQFSDMDIDFDCDLDLFVFDRSSDNIRISPKKTMALDLTTNTFIGEKIDFLQTFAIGQQPLITTQMAQKICLYMV